MLPAFEFVLAENILLTHKIPVLVVKVFVVFSFIFVGMVFRNSKDQARVISSQTRSSLMPSAHIHGYFWEKDLRKKYLCPGNSFSTV